jgi:hypothetical protein
LYEFVDVTDACEPFTVNDNDAVESTSVPESVPAAKALVALADSSAATTNFLDFKNIFPPMAILI